MSRIALVAFLCAALLCATLLEAQAPVLPHRVPLPDWRSFVRGSTAPTPPRVCAIPLLNVLPPAPTEPMPIVRPPGGIQFPILQVRVPAPACDNIRSSPSNEQNPASPH